jgi:hypothetical protein
MTKIQVRKQEWLISVVEAKPAMMAAKADKLCLKFIDMVKASTGEALPTCLPAPPLDTAHSHKRCKRSAGQFTTSIATDLLPHGSPQRKPMTTKKRVNNQSPLCSPI